MTALLVQTAILLCALGMAAAFLRLLRGPDAADRIVALDAMTLQTLVLFPALALEQDRPDLLEPVLLVALVGFVATAALSRLIHRDPP